jgi:hypothetical protein
VRGSCYKVGLADRPPHPKFAERISTSPRKRDEVNHTLAAIPLYSELAFIQLATARPMAGPESS